MGNTASAKEEDVVNGGDAPPPRSYGDPGFPVGSTPPDSPRRSRSPLMFAPQSSFWNGLSMILIDSRNKMMESKVLKDKFQFAEDGLPICTSQEENLVPVAPLQKAADARAVFNEQLMNNSSGPPDANLEKGIPTLITWNYGGKVVLVEGSWDDWTSRKVLHRSGKDHSILLVLPSGIYQYKFIVDGEKRYISDLPSVTDEMGHVANLLDVNEHVPENLESVSEFEPPLSPVSSYGQPFPLDEDYGKDPPGVPPQVHLTVLGHNPEEEEEDSTKPQHVVLNHLFIEKGWASQSLVALGLTHRYQSKYVTVVLYKPTRT